MKTIIINSKPISVHADLERALRTLAASGYCAKMSAFDEGPSWKHRTNVMAQYRKYCGEKTDIFGVKLVPRVLRNYELPHVRAFFDANPRLTMAIVGNKRRVNLIIKKLDAVN